MSGLCQAPFRRPVDDLTAAMGEFGNRDLLTGMLTYFGSKTYFRPKVVIVACRTHCFPSLRCSVATTDVVVIGDFLLWFD